MATKGYIVMRYTGPQGAPGVNEAWNEAAGKVMGGRQAEWRAVGGTAWWITSDVFGNSPRTQFTIEFETVEQALAWYGDPKFVEEIDAFLKIGTLDYQVSVYKLSREG